MFLSFLWKYFWEKLTLSKKVIGSLFGAVDRQDSGDSNLLSSAFGALNIVVASAPESNTDSVKQVTCMTLQRMECILRHNSLTLEELLARNRHLSLLCSLLQMEIERLDVEIIPVCDHIFTVSLQLLESKIDQIVEEDVFTYLGSIANIIHQDFSKYCPQLFPKILAALNNWNAHQTCTSALNLIGDISRALGTSLTPVCDTLMTILFQLVSLPELHVSVKAAIISLFGDIAMAIGDNYKIYMEHVMAVVKVTTDSLIQTQWEEMDDYEAIEMMNLLRQALSEAYQGLIQGVGETNSSLFRPYVDTVMSFVAHVSQDVRRSESVTIGAVGIIGDLIDIYQEEMKQLMSQPFILKFLEEAEEQIQDEQGQETVEFTKKQLDSFAEEEDF
eukprot:TRINITY_DN10945_c0_g4_i3.p1 TRINITY_DN10945_c0_g4~~TRINITY_DN10945_c0_g4_i3.p1  ORF type:complete len:388 (-),score=80.33 TRINITY_DN10945_c0_g4_i3:106-1269(-)